VTYIANNDLGRAQAWLHAHLEEVRKGIEELTLEGETRTGKVEGDAGEE
jgi:hypothetical protein